MKRFIYLLLLAAFFGTLDVMSQTEEPVKYKRRSVLKEIKSNIKSENYTHADELFQSAVKTYEQARNDAEYYYIEANIQMHLALEENKKMYLATSPDTSKYFNHIYNMYHYSLVCDSIESIPDEKNRVRYKYRNDLSSKLLKFRSNLLNAGKYFYNKKQYDNAFNNLDMYLTSHASPIFSGKDARTVIQKDDTVKIPVLAVFSAYAAQKYQNAVKYIDCSLQDTLGRKYLIEIGCKSYAQIGDTANMLGLLNRGFNEYPGYEYYYFTLLNYYNDQMRYNDAHELTARMINHFPKDSRFWYIKGKEEMFMDELDSALVSFSNVITLKTDDAYAYSNIGNIYLYKIHKINKSYQLSIDDPRYGTKKARVVELYRKACENFENAKKYKEDDTSLWLQGLRESYFKLNMGKELKSLEKFK